MSADLVSVIDGPAVAPTPVPTSIREVDAGFWYYPPARDAAVGMWLELVKSPNTRDAYRRDIGQWFWHCDELDVPIHAARRNDVDRWRGQLEADGLKPTSIARKLSAVSSFYGYFQAEDVVARNPAANAKRPARSRKPNTITLTVGQVKQLLGYVDGLADTRPGVIVRLLAETGMRVGELVGARAETLALDAAGHYVLVVRRKGGPDRSLPLTPTTRHKIDVHLAGRATGFIVQTRQTRRDVTGSGQLDRWYVRDLLRRVATEAGLPDDVVDHLHPHVFRASVATIAAAAGEPLTEIQRLLGHTDPRTTEGYIRRVSSLEVSTAYAVAGAIAPDQADAPGPGEL